MKIVNILLAILFTLFAYWQLNDPDALMWVIVYLAVAVVSGIAVVRKLDRRITIFLLVFFVIYALSYTPYILEWILLGMPSITEEMQASTPYVERTREFFGLLICLAAIIYHYFTSTKKYRNV